jgi:hypothetical protein
MNRIQNEGDNCSPEKREYKWFNYLIEEIDEKNKDPKEEPRENLLSCHVIYLDSGK